MSFSGNTEHVVGRLVVKERLVDLGNSSQAAVVSTPAAQALGTGATVTLTTAQMLSGLMTVNPSADAAHTTPTAAEIIAAIPGAVAGQSFKMTFVVTSSTYQITLTAGTGITIVGGAVVLENTSGTFLVRITNVTEDSEAVSIYRL